ncbi:50S ribosomal L11 [Chlorella sorokiniana]|uniref:50S ribosomal L11 n=1 Tax=Chlorella sorokiniana TaxID=3076 RepID=A0A2P6TTZ6_CHLSO|nr:50S ribosomal L11 [Chlorella sorokiniana]|eukprot:PRW57545.1 50S ribosomal L11 [Chlorella sorokiniana]
MQPPQPSAALLGRTLQSAAVPEDLNCKSPLKELYDRHSHCGNLTYDTRRVPHATSQDDNQWMCSLVCPDILRPVTRECVFKEQTFVACGRNKKEAEQRAAFQALCTIRDKAPELGVEPPAVPAVYYNLSSGPSRPTRSTGSTADSYSDLGHAEDYETTRSGGGSGAAAGSLPGTPASSLYRDAAPAAATPPSPPSVLLRPATGLSSRPSEVEVDAMDAAQLRRQLKAALQREAGLRAVLGRLRAEIDGALG